MKIINCKNKSKQSIIATDTMYPTTSHLLNEYDDVLLDVRYSTVYGYSFDDTNILLGTKSYKICSNQFFCFAIEEKQCLISSSGLLWYTVRYGFKGQNVQGDVEKTGRLTYIDGCSDTLLVYPPRRGDPSLNFLKFPESINQTFHTHPSIRMGVVVDGNGVASLKYNDIPLETGSMFMLNEHELHRFRTIENTMSIIAFHPDGDWGPEDHNHTMLNRTYLSK